MAPKIVITDAGRAEILNAQQSGFESVALTHIAFGTGQYTASAAMTALQAEFKRLDTIAGGAVDTDLIHMTILDDSSETYTVYEVGVFTEHGTLFAVYSQTTPIVQKAAQSQAMLAIDIKTADITAASLTIGDTTFVIPPATETRQGLVELATAGETIEGTHNYRAVTPAGLHAKTATSARRGLVQYATDAEVTAGTGTARAVTPAGLQLKMNTHEAKKASSTVSGHVTVDGETVLATNGEISVPIFEGYQTETGTGKAGLVPESNSRIRFLRSDGAWASLDNTVTNTSVSVPPTANAARMAYDRGTEGVERATQVQNFVYNDVMTTIASLDERVTKNTQTPFCINEGPMSSSGAPRILSYSNESVTAEVAYEQPVLTANGTMGENNFAVSADQNSSQAYYPFSSLASEWTSSSTPTAGYPVSLHIYTPREVLLKSIRLQNSATTSRIWSEVTIKASNTPSSSSWVTLTNASNGNRLASQWVTVSVNAAVKYKYFIITFTANYNSNVVAVRKIQLDATYTGTITNNRVMFDGPLIATTAQGERFTADDIPDFEISSTTEARTLYFYLGRSGLPAYTAGQLIISPVAPTAVSSGDIWFKTTEPLATYHWFGSDMGWMEINFAPIGEITLDGTGRITGAVTYPYNQNGYSVNMYSVATTSTMGLMRTASVEDEMNCQCEDAAITPKALYEIANYRQVNTAYSLDDSVACPFHANMVLVCTQAGTTSSEALDTHDIGLDEEIVDGTVIWKTKSTIGNREHFTEDDWTFTGGRQVCELTTVRPVIAVYKETSTDVYTMVTNADVEVLANGVQKIKSLSKFAGYVLTV